MRVVVFSKQTTDRGYETGTSARGLAGTRGHLRHVQKLRFAGLVRRGSTVRVRQRASDFLLLNWPFGCPMGRRLTLSTSTQRPRRGRRHFRSLDALMLPSPTTERRTRRTSVLELINELRSLARSVLARANL